MRCAHKVDRRACDFASATSKLGTYKLLRGLRITTEGAGENPVDCHQSMADDTETQRAYMGHYIW